MPLYWGLECLTTSKRLALAIVYSTLMPTMMTTAAASPVVSSNAIPSDSLYRASAIRNDGNVMFTNRYPKSGELVFASDFSNREIYWVTGTLFRVYSGTSYCESFFSQYTPKNVPDAAQYARKWVSQNLWTTS